MLKLNTEYKIIKILKNQRIFKSIYFETLIVETLFEWEKSWKYNQMLRSILKCFNAK